KQPTRTLPVKELDVAGQPRGGGGGRLRCGRGRVTGALRTAPAEVPNVFPRHIIVNVDCTLRVPGGANVLGVGLGLFQGGPSIGSPPLPLLIDVVVVFYAEAILGRLHPAASLR